MAELHRIQDSNLGARGECECYTYVHLTSTLSLSLSRPTADGRQQTSSRASSLCLWEGVPCGTQLVLGEAIATPG